MKLPPRAERIAERLEERLPPGPASRAIVGDLLEAHRRRAERDPRIAGIWLRVEAARLALRFAARERVTSLAAAVTGRRPPARHRRPSKEGPMTQLMHDLKIASRSLAKRPSATVLVLATLAVCLGVNAAVFGVFDALVVHPFDFPAVDRTVLLVETGPQHSLDKTNVAPGNFVDFRDESHAVLESIAAFEWWDANLRGTESPEAVQGFFVSSPFFDTISIRPQLGRFFAPGDEVAGAERVAVIGDALWRRQFGGDPAILGRPVIVDGDAYTVVGVAPRDFTFPTGCELWAPLHLDGETATKRDAHYLGVIGRLPPNVDRATAQARFDLVAGRLAERFPTTNTERGVQVMTLAEGMGDAGTPQILGLFQIGAAFVLLLGWVNVANLVLARGAERRRELAVLDALGAGRARILRLLLTEGLLLGVGAAVLSLPIAWLSLRLMRNSMPGSIARFIGGWDRMGLDGPLFAATVALALVSVAAFSVWPALRATSGNLAGSLHDGSRGGTAGRSRQRGRNILVVAEVATGLVLVVAAAICARGANNMLHGPLGYDPDGILSFKLALPESRYSDANARLDFARRLESRLGAISGVQSVALANTMPATGNNNSTAVEIEGEPAPQPGHESEADARWVETGYFATLRLPILSGRSLSPDDDREARPVVVVSRSFADRFWPGADPIGKRFRAGADAPWLTVVGVAGDHVHHWFDRRNFPTYFEPYSLLPRYHVSVGVRSTAEPVALKREVRDAVAALDPYQPIYELQTMRRAVYESTIGLQYVAAIMSIFGVLSVILAISGIYGVMAYRVSLRLREIGVRVALGASVSDVLRITLGQAAWLAGLGIAIGLPASLAAGVAVAGVIRGTARVDAAMLTSGTLLLAAVALVAAFVPTRRALALDAATVLRSE